MSLDDIKRNLYKNEADPNLSSHKPDKYDPENVPLVLNNTPGEQDAWKEKEYNLGKEGKKAVKIGAIALGIIIFLSASVAGVYWYRKTSFSQDRVTLSVSGPSEVMSGKLLTYEISYKNDNRAGLKDASLRMVFPDSFKPEENPNFKMDSPVSGTYDLGQITGRSEGKVTLNGRAYAPKSALIYMEGNLSYNPSSYSAQFVSRNRLGISVISTPLELEVVAPQSISSGNEVNYLINYKNSSEEDFDSVKIKAEYPDGFSYAASDPRPFESNNIWYIGRVPAGQTGKIVVSGKLEGESDQVKTAKILIGSSEKGTFVSYNEAETETKIVSSPLAISQTVNKLASLNVNAGDLLLFEINYKNNAGTGMRDVIVTENLDSPVLDYTTLDSEGGAFDSSTKTITWKAPDYAALKNLDSGQSGTIKFSIKVKEILPITSGNDKNFVISSISKIDSPDVPTPVNSNKIISGNRMDMRLNSKLILNALGYYSDGNIENSGPIPPKVDEETTFAMHWKILNISNDISDVKVESSLPTGAVFTGKIYPEDTNVEYNERTNEISWNVGNISAGVGVLSSAREVSFQVKIKPSANQVGKEVQLLESSKISAKDLFTGQDLSSSSGVKTTNLPEDSAINQQYKVVK